MRSTTARSRWARQSKSFRSFSTLAPQTYGASGRLCGEGHIASQDLVRACCLSLPRARAGACGWSPFLHMHTPKLINAMILCQPPCLHGIARRMHSVRRPHCPSAHRRKVKKLSFHAVLACKMPTCCGAHAFFLLGMRRIAWLDGTQLPTVSLP